MTRGTVRYYLHNLDGLRQEIADINADLEQYRAMSSDSFMVCQDADPYKDAPEPSTVLAKGKVKAFSNTQINFNPGHYSDSSAVESLAVNRADFITRLEQELFDKKTIMAAINCALYYLGGYDRQVDKQIIQLRYTEHLPWRQISKKMTYEIQTLKNRDCKIMDEIISNYNARIT